MGTSEEENRVAAANENKPNEKKEKKNWLVEWLRYRPRRLRTAIVTSLVMFGVLSFLALGYLCIFRWLPNLWSWGFYPLSWKAILSILGAIYLVIIPFLPFALVSEAISGIFRLYAEDAEKEFSEPMNEMEQKQLIYERKLDEKDTEGLIPMVTHSRIKLEQYYKIGLSQTQRSYR